MHNGERTKIDKKLLILAYDFPPYVSVGGLRPYAWYKYLKEYGVYPVVVTRQWGNNYGNELDYIAPGESDETIVEETECGTIIRTPYKPNLANRLMLKYGNRKFSFLRKLISAWYELMQFPFFVGPKSGLYRGAKKYLKNNTVDAIIATGEPFVLFKYASTLSKKFNIPWIADYRDPWIQNKNRTKFIGNYFKYIEQKYIANTELIITVEDFFKKQIKENVCKQFYIIPNGFNPEAIQAVSNITQSNDCLRFAFVGTIYKWHPLESILQCFSHFAELEIKPNFELSFYGINNAAELKSIVTKKFPNLIKNINVYPRIDNTLLLKKLSSHNVMLLFNYYYFTGTKIYDYIGIKREILFCYSDDKESLSLKEKYYPIKDISGFSSHQQEEIINFTNSGIIVKDKSHLPQVLFELYDEFLKNGTIACNSINTEKYSRKEGARQLAEIVKNKI